jgi:hypothetical protein
VNTVLNYSISLALGFAGTIETHVNGGGDDMLRGFRGALYFGIGVAGLGMLCSAGLIVNHRRDSKRIEFEIKEEKSQTPTLV